MIIKTRFNKVGRIDVVVQEWDGAIDLPPGAASSGAPPRIADAIVPGEGRGLHEDPLAPHGAAKRVDAAVSDGVHVDQNGGGAVEEDRTNS